MGGFTARSPRSGKDAQAPMMRPPFPRLPPRERESGYYRPHADVPAPRRPPSGCSARGHEACRVLKTLSKPWQEALALLRKAGDVLQCRDSAVYLNPP